MNEHALVRLGTVLLVPFLFACAARTAARHFAPASPVQVRAALTAWDAAADRAASLPPSRLLYDARMGSGVASLPGTLAVTYEGRLIQRASLTGPFGSKIAEYASGTVTGEDRRAFVVDPEALSAVLAGTWPGVPSGVAGCDGAECLLVWNGATSVAGVVDVEASQVRSLVIAGQSGRLAVVYDGAANPWPERIALREERSARSLSLRLAAIEPLGAAGAPDP
ncbi:MAG: hypothetical protein WEB59_00610 [Thermoanaerobaculia bacterium]